MGTNSSKNEDDKDEQGVALITKKKKSSNTINSSFFNGDNLSTYSGIKSETESNGETLDKANTASTVKNDQINVQANLNDGKVPTLFEWNEGGKIVYITGSFCSWTQFFIMSHKTNGSFQLVLDLPRGVYQYKFKVDNQWKYNSKSPFVYDNENNINNIIDTTTIEPPPSSQREITAPSTNDIQRPKPSRNGRSKDVYGYYYPSVVELNTNVPIVPLKYYSNLFNIDYNTRQWAIGNQKYLYKVESNLLSENNSFKSLARIPHISLSHLVYQWKDPRKESYVTICQTSRIRRKLISFVYYKPRKNC